MTFTDTHCHIHESSYEDREGAYQRAMATGVRRLVCVGTDEQSSREAVEFARTHEDVWAAVGLHPHDAKIGLDGIEALEELIIEDRERARTSKESGHGPETPSLDSCLLSPNSVVVAIGECGLDYFYDNSPRQQQIEMLHAQLDLASRYDLPVIFHVRDAKTPDEGVSPEGHRSVWDDFWPIFDSYEGLRGVLHSFTDNLSNLQAGVSRGLLVGVNGISTFARGALQQEMYRSIPVERLLFETDAPFLTPVPHRGMVNEPAFITLVAHYIANLRSISLEELSRATERNATNIFFKHQ